MFKLMLPQVAIPSYHMSVHSFLLDRAFPNSFSDYLVYLAKCSFLPKLNNELLQKNATYKQRITNLKNLVLIMFQEDGVVKPKESSLFGYYADGIPGPVLPLQQTRLYTEDWIGLRTLDETGRLKLISVPGVHLLISLSDTMRYVVPYLKDGA
ncbi:uncharacterized protein [Coffea arabica]|uniref:Uncharacterized protein n=1 Tax=Coffea arabica TaxID=13443 RepID=A0ABM4VCJ5_COFAR